MIESNVTGHAGELAVHTWPNLEATWLAVLVHGYGEHLGRYEHVAAALHDAGALVVGGDLVGHGGSEGERALITDVDALVADVHAVTRSIATPLPTVLIGHSVGGLVASRYAQAHGEELAALVLSAPVLGAWQGLDPLADKEVPDAPLDPSSLSRDEDVATAYAADPLVYHGNWHRETLESLERALDAVASGEPLGDLPTLWLHGDDDRVVPIADTRAGTDRIRGTAFTERVYPGARHEVFNETNRDEVLADVVAFVRAALKL
ncbi:alpha/beta fold hydrolase [Umezawaea tangerina]|uniref:Alpha-beta hydrolase superfamily lysophospholipase n=1 Tax=Umezawaea tangerina TaxID=84725 RepID=A0A2T0TLG8_9PSEU|nr:alpha/beta fold hydrolase [Umezawaea tangerina]PRY46499.1 alpha-beta hydrolase superfamily lysophospholipase [Umezawaea tangerina]